MNTNEEKFEKNINQTTKMNETIKLDDNNIKNNFIFHDQCLKNQNDSLLDEFLSFKNEDLDKFKFEIQDKYILPKNSKVIKEIQSEGKLIRFYENNVIDVITKAQNLTRVFILLIYHFKII